MSEPEVQFPKILPAYCLYTSDREVPERRLTLMPLEFRSQVCKCPAVGKTDSKTYNHVIGICGTCKKPESYYLWRCVSCENLFLRDFVSQFCVREPKCWDCSLDNPSDCSDKYHGYCEYYHPRNEWVAPVLPKPRVFTAEELAGVLDF